MNSKLEQIQIELEKKEREHKAKEAMFAKYINHLKTDH